MPIEFQQSLPRRAHHQSLDKTGYQRWHPQPGTADTLNRLDAMESTSRSTRVQADWYLEIAARGLPRMHKGGVFGHTLRAVRDNSHWSEQLEGDSLRYAAIVALGLSYADTGTQQQILGGSTAADLSRTCAVRAEKSPDTGAVALAAWAAAEAGQFYAAALFRQLGLRLASSAPIATVQCAWALIAALAAAPFADTSDLVSLASERLMSGLSSSGLLPHNLPASASGRLRAHVGCFADQVYTIQALARLHAAQPNAMALSAAEACAERICALQGPAGQWWWHYDARSGGVVEGYPVYSVHQHAMAPMALFDLREAGGTDHSQSIIKGMQWLEKHPEVPAALVVPEKGVIWRKVARREPRKAVRALSAVTTALVPGLHAPGIEMLFPPTTVDYECRPYELGWLMYAWLGAGAVARLAPAAASGTPTLLKEN